MRCVLQQGYMAIKLGSVKQRNLNSEGVWLYSSVYEGNVCMYVLS